MAKTRKDRRELQDLGHGIHLVPLTKGKFALIDSCDAEEVGKFNWVACFVPSTGNWYARRNGPGNKCIPLHRQLMGFPDSLVDHRDCDGLNNRRENLRVATESQNQHNQRRRRDNKSGRKGVTLHRETGRWVATIGVNGKRLYLGLFASIDEAASAYARAAEEYHGEFARTA